MSIFRWWTKRWARSTYGVRLLVLMRRQCADHEIVTEMLADLGTAERLDTFDLDELFQEIDDKGLHVVFLLDEFERVTENPNFGPDFLLWAAQPDDPSQSRPGDIQPTGTH